MKRIEPAETPQEERSEGGKPCDPATIGVHHHKSAQHEKESDPQKSALPYRGKLIEMAVGAEMIKCNQQRADAAATLERLKFSLSHCALPPAAIKHVPPEA